MSKYDLLVNATVVPPTLGVPQFQAVVPPGPNNPNLPPQQQTFELYVNGVGAVSATVQLVVSNNEGGDPSQYNWFAYGDPFTATGTNKGVNSTAMNGAWRAYGAYLTAISGTNASANLRMNAG